jgi:hydroxymethylbilane synthase
MIPACGQAAIALQSRSQDAPLFSGLSHPTTERAVVYERAFLRALGGGCHTAFAGYFDGAKFYAFHEIHGRREIAISGEIDPKEFFEDAFADWV